jgi:hypothetical protein
MKTKIIFEDHRNDESADYWSNQLPLGYRVSIRLDQKKVILKREYFYAGYHDGEIEDDFYFDNEVPWRISQIAIYSGSIFTRNFDTNYLKMIEDELIHKFYEKIIETQKNYKTFLKEKKKEIKKDIKKYKQYETADLFQKIIRKKKLEQINVQSYGQNNRKEFF